MPVMRFSQLVTITGLLFFSTLCAAEEPALATNMPSYQDEQSDGPWSEKVQEVMMNALSLTGIKYKYGGNSPETGFDCSGFVRYVFRQAANLTLPHSARAISQLGQVVSKEELQPGDLVFFNTLRSAFSHVGIYLGNDRFIHSPSSGGGIHIVDMSNSYWTKRFNGARRINNLARTDVQSVQNTGADISQ